MEVRALPELIAVDLGAPVLEGLWMGGPGGGGLGGAAIGGKKGMGSGVVVRY